MARVLLRDHVVKNGRAQPAAPSPQCPLTLHTSVIPTTSAAHRRHAVFYGSCDSLKV